MSKTPCPIASCAGSVVSKRIEGLGSVLGCDGPESHGDATIRNAIQLELDECDGQDDEGTLHSSPSQISIL